MNDDNYSLFQETIGYRFNDERLLVHALTHSSYTNEKHWDKTRCNERLEFLGDAVLEIVSSEYLYNRYPEMPEGEMTKLRASLVCEPTLAYSAEPIALGNYLILGKGEDMTGGRKRPSLISNALEAVIGAIYLDGGLENARTFVERFILDDIEHKKLFYDSKTHLQEIVQAEYKDEPEYEVLKEEGPDHDKTFEVCVKLKGKVIGTGRGRTKKAAEQVAAYNGICAINK